MVFLICIILHFVLIFNHKCKFEEFRKKKSDFHQADDYPNSVLSNALNVFNHVNISTRVERTRFQKKVV